MAIDSTPDVVGDKLAAGSPVRVAVLVSGMRRTLDLLVANHAWALRTLNKPGEVEVDVFFCLSTGQDQQTDGASEPVPADVSKEWAKIFRASGIDLVHVSSTPDQPFPPDKSLRHITANERSSLLHVAWQFQSLAKAYDVLERHEADHGHAYDVVVRMRSDAVFLEPIDLRALYSAVRPERIGRPQLITPNYGDYGGVHDRFGIMDRAAAQSYFRRRYTYWMREQGLPTYESDFFLGNPNAEAYMRATLLYDGVQVHAVGSLHMQIAPHGCFTYWPECDHKGGEAVAAECKALGCNGAVPFEYLDEHPDVVRILECNFHRRAAPALPMPADCVDRAAVFDSKGWPSRR